MTSYIKISQILKLKSKDITSKTLHAKFYASRIKNKRIRRGVKYAPRVWSVFKSPGKIGLSPQQQGVRNKINLKTDDNWKSNIFTRYRLHAVIKSLQKYTHISLEFGETQDQTFKIRHSFTYTFSLIRRL